MHDDGKCNDCYRPPTSPLQVVVSEVRKHGHHIGDAALVPVACGSSGMVVDVHEGVCKLNHTIHRQDVEL